MEEQFVPFELAIKLKELGFNLSCLAYYTKYFPHHIHIGDPTWQRIILNNDGLIISAPLWQQAFDWFRDKHYMPNWVFESIGDWYYKIVKGEYWVEDNVKFKTYQEARQACLEKLIEIININ